MNRWEGHEPLRNLFPACACRRRFGSGSAGLPHPLSSGRGMFSPCRQKRSVPLASTLSATPLTMATRCWGGWHYHHEPALADGLLVYSYAPCTGSRRIPLGKRDIEATSPGQAGRPRALTHRVAQRQRPYRHYRDLGDRPGPVRCVSTTTSAVSCQTRSPPLPGATRQRIHHRYGPAAAQRIAANCATLMVDRTRQRHRQATAWRWQRPPPPRQGRRTHSAVRPDSGPNPSRWSDTRFGYRPDDQASRRAVEG